MKERTSHRLRTKVAQLEATIPSPHALLKAGLIDEAISLLAAFSNGIQPNIGRSFIEYRPIKRGS